MASSVSTASPHNVAGPIAGSKRAISFHELRRARTTVGRDATCGIRLPHAEVSGEHAELLVERRGLKVRAARLVTATREVGETHYAEHKEKPFFGELVDFITSGPTLAFVLEGEGAIATCRKTIGATNPAECDERQRTRQHADPSELARNRTKRRTGFHIERVRR